MSDPVLGLSGPHTILSSLCPTLSRVVLNLSHPFPDLSRPYSILSIVCPSCSKVCPALCLSVSCLCLVCPGSIPSYSTLTRVCPKLFYSVSGLAHIIPSCPVFVRSCNGSVPSFYNPVLSLFHPFPDRPLFIPPFTESIQTLFHPVPFLSHLLHGSAPSYFILSLVRPKLISYCPVSIQTLFKVCPTIFDPDRPSSHPVSGLSRPYPILFRLLVCHKQGRLNHVPGLFLSHPVPCLSHVISSCPGYVLNLSRTVPCLSHPAKGLSHIISFCRMSVPHCPWSVPSYSTLTCVWP